VENFRVTALLSLIMGIHFICICSHQNWVAVEVSSQMHGSSDSVQLPLHLGESAGEELWASWPAHSPDLSSWWFCFEVTSEWKGAFLCTADHRGLLGRNAKANYSGRSRQGETCERDCGSVYAKMGNISMMCY
jgi:hypothetical protein